MIKKKNYGKINRIGRIIIKKKNYGKINTILIVINVIKNN